MRVRDAVLCASHALLMAVVLAAPTGNPGFAYPVSLEVYVVIVLALTILGGLAVGFVVASPWSLLVSGAIVLLSVPIVAVNVIVHDPAPDGQGGLHIFLLALLTAAAIGAGVGLASTRHQTHATRQSR